MTSWSDGPPAGARREPASGGGQEGPSPATTASQHLPAGSAASGPYALEVTPESAGWGHSSLRVLELPAGGSHVLDTGPDEVVVVDNGGGHIFSMLPQVDLPEHRRLFVTPHDLTLAATSEALGIDSLRIDTADDLTRTLQRPSASGVKVVSVRTSPRRDRDRRSTLHTELTDALA